MAKFGRVDPTDFEDVYEWVIEGTAPIAICKAALKALSLVVSADAPPATTPTNSSECSQ